MNVLLCLSKILDFLTLKPKVNIQSNPFLTTSLSTRNKRQNKINPIITYNTRAMTLPQIGCFKQGKSILNINGIEGDWKKEIYPLICKNGMVIEDSFKLILTNRMTGKQLVFYFKSFVFKHF